MISHVRYRLYANFFESEVILARSDLSSHVEQSNFEWIRSDGEGGTFKYVEKNLPGAHPFHAPLPSRTSRALRKETAASKAKKS